MTKEELMNAISGLPVETQGNISKIKLKAPSVDCVTR